MKKIALFLVVCCLSCFSVVGGAYATCGGSTLGFDGNQDPDDDEFLYTSKKQFEDTKNGYENSNHQNSGSGIGIECDTTNSAACGKGAIRTMAPGHVFKGQVVNVEKKYQCSIRPFGDDLWKEVEEHCETRWGVIPIGQSLTDKKTTSECSGLNKTETDEKAVKLWQVICRDGGIAWCKPTDCATGYKLDRPNGRCVKDCSGAGCNDKKKTTKKTVTDVSGCVEIDGKTKVAKGKNSVHQVCQVVALSEAGAEQCVCQCIDNNNWRCDVTSCKGDTHGHNYSWIENEINITGGKGICKEVKKGAPVTKSCKESRKTQTGKACCDVPKSEANYDAENDKCDCVGGKEFKIENGKGVCVAKVTPNPVRSDNPVNRDPVRPEPLNPDPVEPEFVSPEEGLTDCVYTFDAEMECYGIIRRVHRTTTLNKVQLGNKSCAEFNRLYAVDVYKAMELFGNLCVVEYSEAPVVNNVVDNEVNREAEKRAEETLKKFFADAESNRSVWKNADGKFNTTRLASDITAGVVLGTVGGVVTGVVIKKNQLKKGFEALHCSVGGQKIAEWGDEFRVGLR